MSTSTTPNPKPLFAALIAFFVLLAVVIVLKLFALLTTIAIGCLVVIGLYEAYRFVSLLRGGIPPPSSVGLIRAPAESG